MDRNRKEGGKYQIKGTVREVAGKISGNKPKEVAGKIEKNTGKVQKVVGQTADEIRRQDRKQR